MAALSDVKEYNLAPGLKIVTALVTGAASYDSTNGDALDVSSYVQTMDYVSIKGGVTAAGDALVKADYVNDDFDDADGGALFYTWSADGTDGEPFINVTNATDMSGYQFQLLIIGTEVTRT